MFRLIRLCIYGLAIFVAGVVYERGAQKDLCADNGGAWVAPGICDKG